MKPNKTFLLFSFILIVIILLFIQNKVMAQDPLEPDTVYFSCGSDSSTNGDTLYIPCNGTHDVRIKINVWSDSLLLGITAPLINNCYTQTNGAYLDSAKNKPDSSYEGSGVEDWGSKNVNLILDSTTHQVLYACVTFGTPLDAGDTLFATMIYTVRDTGKICLDTLYFPPNNVLTLVKPPATGYTPVLKPKTFFIVARDSNYFPALTVPSDIDTFMCKPDTLCLVVQADDSDDGDTIILEKIEGAGTFDPDTAIMPGPITDSICFVPDTAGTYKFVFKVSDQCPAEVYDTFLVTVTINEPPLLSVPSDTSVFLCEPETLCFDVDFSDPDNSIDTIIVNLPWYYQSSDTSVCLYASSETSYPCTVIVTDSCDVADTGIFNLTIDLNEPPVVTVPSDTSIFLCEPETLCFNIDISDPDNPGDVVVNSPWYYQSADTSVCLFASAEMTYCCTVIVTDSCEADPAADTGTFCATIDLNEPPAVTVPADFDTFLCDPETLCFAVQASDPGDTIILKKIEGPGIFAPDTGVSTLSDTICFEPDSSDSIYSFIFEVVDSCGAVDRDTFNLTVNINDPPVIFAPDTLWVIRDSSAVDTFSAADPDSNIIVDTAGVILYPDCGVVDSLVRISGRGGPSGEWKVAFSDTGCPVDTIYAMIVDLRDTLEAEGCSSKVAYDTILVIIRDSTHYNNPPLVFSVWDTTGRPGDTLKLIFTAADPDSDIILDTSVVFVTPTPCGSTFSERMTGSGEPRGEWRVTFYTEDCSTGTYWIDLNLQDFLGAWGWDSARVILQTTDVPETSAIVMTDFVLEQNYPNPFNLKTSLSFKIPYGCGVSLKIYNLSGRLVNTLVDRKMDKGQHTIYWDGTGSTGHPVASGIYFYKLTASDFVSVKKMILLK